MSLRSVIKKNDADSAEWPHTPNSLAGNNVKVPTMLNQFLVCILCGELNPKSIPNRTKWLKQAFPKTKSMRLVVASKNHQSIYY